MPTKTRKDIKTAILDAAELLMAEHGIKGVSLRGILAEAGTNAASLHYHFGSREGLIEAIISRRGRGIELRRREMLEEIEARVGTASVHDVVAAAVNPMLEVLREEGESGRRFLRFLARLQSDRAGIHHDLEKLHFPDVIDRMTALLAVACPDLPEAERKRRRTMMIDTMLQSLAHADFMLEEWKAETHEATLDEFAGTLKSFLAGGLAAPIG